MFERIDHIGIVVASIDDALQTYRDQLGFTLLERVEIPEQLVEAAFLDAHNGTIELIAPNRSKKSKAQDGRKLRRYRCRWRVERLFAWMHNFRRLVTRWEYHIENFLGFVRLACLQLLLRYL